MTESRVTHLDWFWLLTIAVLSFFVSAPPFYPFLNSDIAVHVLMSHDFSFQNDMYYWSQDRLGSFVPMVAYLIKALSGFPAVWAVSVVKWLLLVFGAACFWYFMPLRLFRWAFSVLWFFPIYELRFLLLPGHPYGEQLAFLALSFICFDRAVLRSRFWFFPAFIASAVISIWISDFSLFFFLLLSLFYSKPLLRFLYSFFSWNHRIKILASTIISLLGLVLLLYAKLHSVRDPSYTLQMFASLDQFLHSLDLLWFYTRNVIFFQSISFWNSFAFFSAFGLSFLFLVNYRSLGGWQAYFLLSFLLGFTFISSLRWLSINYVMLKYFIPTFYALWAGFCAISPALFSRYKIILSTLLIILSLSSVFSLLHVYSLYVQDQDPVCISLDDVQTIEHSHKRFFIGEYWHSYVLSIAHPDEVVSTPHDRDFLRHNAPVLATLRSDTIILVANNWLNTVPDSIVQYNHLLVSTGNVWKEGKFEFAEFLNVGKANH
ncbi:MAG: hypothetical protein R2813_03290 [Flavobacteriales bacterium]